VGMNPALARRLADADCLLAIGARLGDVTTGGYRLIDPAAPGKMIIHCHPDPGEPGRVYHPDLALAASAESLLAALAAHPAPESSRPWAAWTIAARAAYEAWQIPQETPGAVKLEAIVAQLSVLLPEDAIITNGAGNYAAFVHRYFCFKRYGTQLAPTSGSMGYAFPAAISAKLEHPDRTVICFAGDGSFQVTLNEFATAIQHGAKVIVIVANNGKYATIRMHQEKTYPGRVSGTTLVNPDFAALARAYGGYGETVARTEDFAAAFARAMACGSPAVIELRLDDEVMTTSATLSETRAFGRRG